MRNINIQISTVASLTNNNAICTAVPLVANESLHFNGNLIDPILNTALILKNTNTTRNLRLQSLVDLSSVSFTIKGKQNDQEIVETLSGPNGILFVETVNVFDEVLSITPDQSNLNLIDVTIGSEAYILIPIDLYRTNLNYNFSLVAESKGEDPFQINNLHLYSSLKNINDIPLTFQRIIEEGYLHSTDSQTDFFTEYMLPQAFSQRVVLNYLMKVTIPSQDIISRDIIEFVNFDFIQV
jgi:hypothetical protein